MPRPRKNIEKEIRDMEEEALLSLGMGKNRWTWDDESEEVRENREADVTEKLRSDLWN